MATKSKTHLIGRSSITGRLESVEDARKHPNSSTVERMPNSGYGDTKSDKKSD
jgi:hypothetical protein